MVQRCLLGKKQSNFSLVSSYSAGKFVPEKNYGRLCFFPPQTAEKTGQEFSGRQYYCRKYILNLRIKAELFTARGDATVYVWYLYSLQGVESSFREKDPIPQFVSLSILQAQCAVTLKMVIFFIHRQLQLTKIQNYANHYI